MQTFFNTATPLRQVALALPQWNFIRANLIRNVQTVQGYYSTRPFAVRSQHFLVRLLNTIGVSYKLPIDRFYDLVDTKALAHSMVMKMTSSVYKGAIHPGVFYGEGNSEILVAVTDPVNPMETYKNWRTVSAVNPISHEISDTSLMLPNGRSSSVDKGICVIGINIAQLAVQYRGFLDYMQKEYLDQGLSPLTTMQFIHMFVLPNMMAGHLDLVLFNRAYNLLMGAPMGSATKKHPFYLTDYSKLIDQTYTEAIKYFKGQSKEFKAILSTFPAAFSDSFEEALRIPDEAPTRQIVFSEVIARLKVIDFLTSFTPDAGTTRSRSEINDVMRTLKYYDRDRSILSLLPGELGVSVVSRMNDIKKRVGNNL